MRPCRPVKGVYLSSTVDLETEYNEAFEPVSDLILLRAPHEVSNPAEIRFALSWKPEDGAFMPYGNIDMVSSIGAGVDNILNCPSLPANAIVTRICDPDQAYMMAQFVIWQVVWYHRNMRQYLVNQKNHNWHWVDRLPTKDCNVGVLGFGKLGQAVTKALVSLGFPVFAACRNRRDKADCPGITLFAGSRSIRDAAAQSDILINLLPLTSKTVGVLNADLFSRMPRSSVLIQVGRGEHLVEEDFISALDSGQLSAATLDVFRNEPLPSDHRYWSDPRIMVTPHDASESGKSVVVKQVTACVVDLLQGKIPRFAVDRGRGY